MTGYRASRQWHTSLLGGGHSHPRQDENPCFSDFPEDQRYEEETLVLGAEKGYGPKLEGAEHVQLKEQSTCWRIRQAEHPIFCNQYVLWGGQSKGLRGLLW